MANSPDPAFWDSTSAEPLLPEANEVWQSVQQAGWGDPLRLHRAGRQAAAALDQARAAVAEVVGARPDEVVFTASGPHAAQAAIAGLALGRKRVGQRIVHSTIEHSSVLKAAQASGEPVPVEVDHLGRVALDQFQAALTQPGTALACLQVANHEVGTIQPYAEAAEAAAAAEVPFVLDATAALGRLDLTNAGPWSALIGAAGAFGGPVGVGFLVLRRKVRWRAPYPVDDYQSGRWPGPPDVASILAAAVALQAWNQKRDEIAARQMRLIDRLRAGIAAAIPDVEIAGDPVHRLPHVLTFSVLYVDGETLTLELDKSGFAVASGSACSATSDQPSHVLAAMGALTHGNVRIGLTVASDNAQVDRFLQALPPIVAQIRSTLGAP